ncbi:MAG: pyrroloquinoline quinone-dependent dehydrogenase [Bryobacteraceae bacterium]
MTRTFTPMLAAVLASILMMPGDAQPRKDWEWQFYGGDAGSSRYSPLSQINLANVARLKVAWTYRTGDKSDRPVTQIQCTPIIVDGVMYLTTPQIKVAAVQADTGEPLWTFDPFENSDDDRPRGVNRGVTYWQNGTDKRILFTYRSYLVALDAKTGKPVPSFGANGQVDLTKGLDRDIGGLAYYITSPGAVYRDLIILGSTTGEGPRPSAPGHVRAFDVRTGQQKWIFHTIPHPGEFGYDTWPPDAWKRAGGANDWGGLSVDEKRGWVFLALGSPTFDFYGGDRLGDNLFGNSIVALNATTGKRIWHYQTVRHDIWDYDLPCNPNLVTVTHNGRKVDAVAQVTKTGMTFLLDRETGKPLFPVEERRMAPSDISGEKLAPTQPFPVKPPPFSRHRFFEEDITNLSPKKRAYVLERYRKLAAGEIYTPLSLKGNAVYPGFAGGANWGGASFDPGSGLLYVSSNESISLMTLVGAPKDAGFPFDHKGYGQLYDDEGYPSMRPPWGQLTALDLNKGEIQWQIVLGEHPELKAPGIPPTGTNNFGGSIVTAGGLVFIGATQDSKFRAFDAKTGKTVWETQMETGAYATPATYEVGGKQYVVVAVGGGRLKTPAGDSFVAFSLP